MADPLAGRRLITDYQSEYNRGTVEAIERVWETLDAQRPGVVFTSSDIWRRSGAQYHRTRAVLRRAVELGYVIRLGRSRTHQGGPVEYVIPTSGGR